MLWDRSRRSRITVLLVALSGVGSAMALDIDDVRVEKQGRAYEVQMTFGVAASVYQVMAVLTDYGFPSRLNPDVVKREVINTQEGITRVRTEIRSCVLFFCKDLVLTQDVRVFAGTIQAHTVADESDFLSGHLRWLVSNGDYGTALIRFDAVMEPDFFIPPLIGGYFARKRLRQEILATAKNLEIEATREPHE